jgi:hypothetical protein
VRIVLSKADGAAVLTNIKYDELHKIMSFVRYEVSSNNTYIYDSGLKVKWDVYGKYAVAHLFGDIDSDCLQAEGEKYFQTLDKVAQRNVRLIDSAEFFYYRYDTSYKKISEIYESLKDQCAAQIFTTEDDEIVSAIRYHTTAKADMSPLCKLLYLADFTSADRDYPDVDVMRKLVDESLQKALVYALQYTIKDLCDQKRAVHFDTLAAYNEAVTSQEEK